MSDGAPSPTLPAVCNMAAYVHEHAHQRPRKLAILCPHSRDWMGRVAYTSWNFAHLEQEIERLARGLLKLGIKRGTRVALMVPPSLEFFSLTFALFRLGAVVILIDPGVGIKNLGICLGEAEPEAFIGVTKAHAARVLLRWAPESIKTCVTVGTRLFWGGHTLDDIRVDGPDPVPVTDMPPDEMAAIFFTSGSTGVAKGAVYTHRILTHQVVFIQEMYRFGPDDVDLATFPLFGLIDVALGMTVVIPDMDATKPAKADPVKLAEAIDQHGVSVMFGSPALLNTFSRYGEATGRKLPTLRKAISCGAPARNDVLRRFQDMLPDGVEIFTPYGATEALPVSSIGSGEILGETCRETAQGGGTCIGKPIPHVWVGIMKISDEAVPTWSEDLLLPQGEIGEIVVKGPIVTRAYFKRPEQTALAKIVSVDGSEVYHRMGDLGRFDAQGRLWFCGRKSHRVVTSEGPLFTIPCEAIFNEQPEVYRTALVGVGAKGDQTPVLCVELEPNVNWHDLEKIKGELLVRGNAHPTTRSIKKILFHDGFPVDVRHNAKINRESLAVWAEEQLKAGVA